VGMVIGKALERFPVSGDNGQSVQGMIKVLVNVK